MSQSTKGPFLIIILTKNLSAVKVVREGENEVCMIWYSSQSEWRGNKKRLKIEITIKNNTTNNKEKTYVSFFYSIESTRAFFSHYLSVYYIHTRFHLSSLQIHSLYCKKRSCGVFYSLFYYPLWCWWYHAANQTHLTSHFLAGR